MTSKIVAFTHFPLRLGLMRIGIGRRFVLAIAVIAAYMAASRFIYRIEGLTFAEIELLRTPLRLVGAGLLWLLMADIIFARHAQPQALRSPLAIIGLGLVMISPILTYDYEASVAESSILALTSLPVALFEELFFRAILQTLLVRYVGVVQGICLATIGFGLYHLGATTPEAFNLIFIFLAGAIYGLIYLKTGSIIAVTFVHALDDMLSTLPIDAVLPPGAAVIFLLIAISCFTRWINWDGARTS